MNEKADKNIELQTCGSGHPICWKLSHKAFHSKRYPRLLVKRPSRSHRKTTIAVRQGNKSRPPCIFSFIYILLYYLND